MSYCRNCGSKLDEDAKYCPNCGKEVESTNTTFNYSEDNFNGNIDSKKNWTGIKITSFIFMLVGIFFTISTIVTWFISENGTNFRFSFPIALIWQIPMTYYYYRCVTNKTKTSTGFKVCTLIFVSLIAGILMLCDKDDKN